MPLTLKPVVLRLRNPGVLIHMITMKHYKIAQTGGPFQSVLTVSALKKLMCFMDTALGIGPPLFEACCGVWRSRKLWSSQHSPWKASMAPGAGLYSKVRLDPGRLFSRGHDINWSFRKGDWRCKWERGWRYRYIVLWSYETLKNILNSERTRKLVVNIK